MHGRRHTFPSTRAGATQTSPCSWSASARRALCSSTSATASGHVAERDDRERRLAAQGLELGVSGDLGVEQARLAEVPLDRGPDRIRTVRAEREPQLERAEGSRVLERDVDHVVVGPLVRDVVLLVRERAVEVRVAANEHDAACLGEIQPLVGVQRHRVRALEAREEVPGGRCGRCRQAVRPVHVEPDTAGLADVRQRVDRVDCARERRAGGGHDRDRRDPRPAVAVDHRRDGIRAQPPPLVLRQRANQVGADAEELRRADDGVVGLARAVEGAAGLRHARSGATPGSPARAPPQAP